MVPTFNRVAQEVRLAPCYARTVRLTGKLLSQLIGVLREKTTAPRTEIDVSQYFSRYTLESVGRAALGTSFGSLGAEDSTDYSRALKEFG